MLNQYFTLIFVGATLLGCLAMYGRQPLIVVYVALGILVGPYGLDWIGELETVRELAHLGIIFLLFLLGLDMQVSALKAVAHKALFITLLSSLLFFGIGYLFGLSLGMPVIECIVVGVCLLFSSTIIGIKLLPTTVLHHKHIGELMVGLLLMQDFIAILALMVLIGWGSGSFTWGSLSMVFIGLPVLIIVTQLSVKYIVFPVIARFDRISEFVFLLALGWCLGVAELAQHIGLSTEIGAFIAGVGLATHPISKYIALHLKPLRDFFLVIFFFYVGAGLNIGFLSEVALAAVALAIIVVVLKPLVFKWLVMIQGESKTLAWDIGFRLGQISEFSLLIVVLAMTNQLITEQTATMLQAATILTFIASSYIIVFNYPNPIAVNEKLRRD